MRTLELSRGPMDSGQVLSAEKVLSTDGEIKAVIIKNVDFQNPQDLKRLILRVLTKQGVNSLTLSGIHLSENILSLICSTGAPLQRLTIEYCTVDPEAAFVLSTVQNTHLKQLCLSNLGATTAQLDTLLRSIAFFPHLNQLNLSMHLGVLGQQISEIIKKCPDLGSLNLTSAVIDESSLMSILAAIEQHHNLTKLCCVAAVNENYANLPSEFLSSLQTILRRNFDQNPHAPGEGSFFPSAIRSSPSLEVTDNDRKDIAFD